MKYSVEVGSFCTRFVKRTITVNAKDENEAGLKAIDKFVEQENKLANASDVGSPQVDSIEVVNGK